MENLANLKILSHEEMKFLVEGEVHEYMKMLDGRWETMENPPVMIRARYKFEDFTKAMEFVSRVAKVAEDAGHHPDITINYNKVEIILWSHFINGLSLNDFIVAARIDEI